MKTAISKVWILLIVSMFISAATMAQEVKLSKKEQKKLAKEQKKAEKEAENQREYELTLALAESQRFVFQATNISGEAVTPRLNFLIVEGNKMVFQLAIGSEIGGWNGIGGITVKGYVDSYKVTPPKSNKKPIRINLNGTPEKYNRSTPFILNLYGDQYADLVIGGISLRGSILKPEEAKLFVGSWF